MIKEIIRSLLKKIQKKINFQPKENLKKSIAELLNKYKKAK